MPLTRARCVTEGRNLSSFSPDPNVAETAKSQHQAAQPSHSVTIIVEQVGSLVAANLIARGTKRGGKTAKKRAATKKRSAGKKRQVATKSARKPLRGGKTRS